jgi:hypothetical protein
MIKTPPPHSFSVIIPQNLNHSRFRKPADKAETLRKQGDVKKHSGQRENSFKMGKVSGRIL